MTQERLVPGTAELLFHRRGSVGWITFNRPQALNAMTQEMEAALTRLFAAVNHDGDLRALVLTGAPGRKPSFMAGSDMGDLSEVGSEADAMACEARAEALVQALESVRAPTIAAIAGVCLGMGATIAAACDVRVVSASARFGYPIARNVGICLTAVNFQRLVALMGFARTRELIFTARLLSASELVSLGLARELVEDEAAFVERVTAVAEDLTALAPLTLWATKETLRRLRDAGCTDVDTNDLLLSCYLSEDYRTAMAAFAAKTKPVFKGR